MLAAITGILSANRSTPALFCEPDIYYYGPENDPFYTNVVLLLHADGVEGGTTFVDNSKYARTPSLVSGCVTSTIDPKFGTAAVKATTICTRFYTPTNHIVTD